MKQSDKNEYFQLDKSVPLILYGAATIGRLLYQYLTGQNFRVAGFMDTRADEIGELCGLPVFSVDDDKVSRECVIIIAVKNVFEHERIAAELQKRGYYRLIYRPYEVLGGQGNSLERELNEVYDKIADYKNGKEIPKIVVPMSVRTEQSRMKLSGVISESENSITAYVPVTLVYTDKKENEPEYSILFLKSHLKFVRYVLGMEGGSLEDYLSYCMEGARKVGGFRITEAWKRNVVKSRAEVYAQMNHKYHLDRSFFEQQAPMAEWNVERKYFNLQSGKHRATFLAASGQNYIAVKMLKDDYRLWVQESMVQEVCKEVENAFLPGMAIPVENPYFYGYSSCEEQFWYQLIRTMIENIPEAVYSSKDPKINKPCSFLVAVQEFAFVKRYLWRAGFCVYQFENAGKLEGMINCLTGFKDEFCNAADLEEEFTYALFEEASDRYRENQWKVKNTFLISNHVYEKDNRIMTGIYQGKETAVYLKR